MKRSFFVVFLIMILMVSGCATALEEEQALPEAASVEPPALEEAAASPDEDVFIAGIAEIQKYGNITLAMPFSVLSDAGFEFGDMLKVALNGKEDIVPLCTNYSDVDTGSKVVRVKGDTVIVAINMGDYATEAGIAEKVKADDGSVTWVFPEGKDIGSFSVALSMAEKGGYRDEYLMHQLERTNDRKDYESDEVFANFRNIRFGDMGEGTLWRSSSPVNDELGRASFADDLIEKHGIKTVVNLADSGEKILGYAGKEGFDSLYYLTLYFRGGVRALDLGVDFAAEDFRKGLAEGLRFIAGNDGPYLIHCTEGKDRAGFTAMLLSAYMGATYDEIVDDYMKSYENYYHLEKGSEQWNAVRDSNIVKELELLTGSSEPEKCDLREAAERYVEDLGFSLVEMGLLREHLWETWD